MKVLKRLRFVVKFWRFLPFLKDYFFSKEVSLGKKALPVAAILTYIFLPIDIIPDFFAVFGWTDDLFVSTFILQLLAGLAPESLKKKYPELNEP
ncbi:YkvA family protein [Staphylospora marina]|uniref:YkvA family protein n=1 Tax=Staphylospora marina TaxID=2490858 RepID=UPI000F5BC6A5|nr:DUF1232 domain-containing protein [Staphylospora marina]